MLAYFQPKVNGEKQNRELVAAKTGAKILTVQCLSKTYQNVENNHTHTHLSVITFYFSIYN